MGHLRKKGDTPSLTSRALLFCVRQELLLEKATCCPSSRFCMRDSLRWACVFALHVVISGQREKSGIATSSVTLQAHLEQCCRVSRTPTSLRSGSTLQLAGSTLSLSLTVPHVKSCSCCVASDFSQSPHQEKDELAVRPFRLLMFESFRPSHLSSCRKMLGPLCFVTVTLVITQCLRFESPW